jgi:fibronectin-binding autotransporter adhesin
MKSSRFSPFFIACVSVASSLASTAFGLNFQWDVNGNAAGLGGAGTWNSTNAFWDLVPDGSDDGTAVTVAHTFTSADTAIFGGTAGNVTVDTVTLGGLNLTSSGYNFSSGTINMGASPTLSQPGLRPGKTGTTALLKGTP